VCFVCAVRGRFLPFSVFFLEGDSRREVRGADFPLSSRLFFFLFFYW